jgi:hypothetical protein
MHFCAITPIKWLGMFDTGPTHMALAQELKHPDYFAYYNKMLTQGHTVILDNGAYENEQLDYKQLIDCILRLQPTYYVLPDDPGDFKSSSMMSLDFINYCASRRIHLNSKSLWVVHAEDEDLPNFVNSYELGVFNAEGVCFSRLTNAYGLPDEMPQLRRVQFIDYLKRLKKWHTGKYHHCLGLLSGSMLELPYLNARGINSVDSSAPVWRGLMGLSLYDHWPDFPFEVNPTHTSEARTEKGIKGEVMAHRNLEEVREACNQLR